jgi:hypothetical protein
VRTKRARKKKLTVAFHFQFGNRAGWDCESCRRNGLEEKRRCGFLPSGRRGTPKIVWARRDARTEECPTSFITGDSLALVEEFFVRRRLGIPYSIDMEARKTDAFLILRDKMESEERNG